MDFIKILWEEVISFLGGRGGLIEIFQSGDYHSLLTLKGIQSAVSPLIPFILILEILRALLYRKFKAADYKVTSLDLRVQPVCLAVHLHRCGCVLHWVFLNPGPFFKSNFTWYWLIYGYIVWEFAHFIYHYLAPKVRLFWCLHSTHHAPENMNLSVTYAHFFLEAPYADVIRTSICILAGVNPPLLFFIMFVDGTWGAFIHVGENILKDGRLGFLNHVILTPSHHRVHHARNPLYMDTNFCNLLNVWDRIFGTFPALEKGEVAIEYGITRR